MPPGLQYSTDNSFIRRLKELQDSATFEKNPLIPSTPEEMGEMLQLCSYVRFKVPQQVCDPAAGCLLLPEGQWPAQPASGTLPPALTYLFTYLSLVHGCRQSKENVCS